MVLGAPPVHTAKKSLSSTWLTQALNPDVDWRAVEEAYLGNQPVPITHVDGFFSPKALAILVDLARGNSIFVENRWVLCSCCTPVTFGSEAMCALPRDDCPCNLSCHRPSLMLKTPLFQQAKEPWTLLTFRRPYTAWHLTSSSFSADHQLTRLDFFQQLCFFLRLGGKNEPIITVVTFFARTGSTTSAHTPVRV